MRDKKLVILIVLSIFAVISLIYGIVASSKGKVKKAPTVTGENLQQASSQELVFSERRAKRSKFTSWKRNPFTLQKTSSKAFKGLVLSGIMWDKGKPLAIINGEIVKIGDNVSGNIVVDIKQDRVILNDGIKDFELKLGQ